MLLIGFAHTDDGDKILNVGLRGYTPDVNVTTPLDAAVFAWRDGDNANKVRLVARTNLSTTASTAQEDRRHQAGLAQGCRGSRRCGGDRR